MLMDFHETFITGILLTRLSKISCIWKTFCIILCFLHSIFHFICVFLGECGDLILYLVTICIIHLTFCFVYSNVFTHTPTHTCPHTHRYIHASIHTCMYVNVSDNYLFVPNAVLKSMCMLYLSPSLCYIDSLCNFPAKMLTSVYNAHNNKNNNNDKRVIV